ncbi:MAG: hypothetical protein ACK528_09760 [Alphaproteobacteria bacterium]
MDEDAKSASPLWAFNPETRRYVLRNGPTWARLVERGVASDPELQEQWAAAKEGTSQAQIARAREARAIGIGICGGAQPEATKHTPPPNRPAIAAAAPMQAVGREDPALSARDVLRQLAVENREALCREDLTREEAEALLRRAFEARAQPKTASRRWTLNA